MKRCVLWYMLKRLSRFIFIATIPWALLYAFYQTGRWAYSFLGVRGGNTERYCYLSFFISLLLFLSCGLLRDLYKKAVRTCKYGMNATHPPRNPVRIKWWMP